MFSRIWLGLFLLVFASTHGAVKPSGKPVKLGFFMSITGRDASFGEAALRGARLAIDNLNAAGGILGRPAELVVEDNRSLPGESATAVKKLIARDKVVALIGECASSRTLEAAPIAQKAGNTIDHACINESPGDCGRRLYLSHVLRRSVPRRGAG
jgi:branched-chain amino acid transport system substrate-binding protein